jgi:phosphatidylserine/phosphatidylglycerophosphate/cardiolipin synthase-like enzyme
VDVIKSLARLSSDILIRLFERCVVKPQREAQNIQLVISAPISDISKIAHDIGVRTTLGVLTTLIAQAEDHLILAAPFMQSDEGLNQEPLMGALIAALQRGVVIDFASTRTSLDTLDRDKLRVVAKRYIRFYQPTANFNDTSKLGLHAKFCVADGKRAYIGSANLTKPGLQEHFEMGVLVQGDTAFQVDVLWRYLVDRGFFVEIQ